VSNIGALSLSGRGLEADEHFAKFLPSAMDEDTDRIAGDLQLRGNVLVAHLFHAMEPDCFSLPIRKLCNGPPQDFRKRSPNPYLPHRAA